MFTKAKLLAYLRTQGFTVDKPTAADCKNFIAEKNLELVFDGKAVDVDALFTAKRVNLEEFATTEEIDEKAEDFKKAKKDAIKAARSGRSGEVANAIETDAKPMSVKAWMRMSEAKRYNQKAALGKTCFPDADAAEFFTAVARLRIADLLPDGWNYSEKANDRDIVTKASQGEFDNTLGGALVPIEFSQQLIWLTEQYGAAQRVANVVTMGKEAMTVPRKTGIVSFSFSPENATATSKTDSFDNVKLVSEKVFAIKQIPTELFEDSAINVSDVLTSGFGEAYQIIQDDCFFNGDGTSTYGGMLGLKNALPSGAYINGTGAWTAFTVPDHTSLMGSVQNVGNSFSECVWVCSRQYYLTVMMRLDKQATQYKDLSGPGLNGADATFLGHSVYFSQRMPTTGGNTVKSVYFGKMKDVGKLGIRRDLSIVSSDQAYWSSDQIGIRGTARFAVNIHGDGRGSTVGPVACLVATA